MDVFDERIFLEEVARRLNLFVQECPEEANDLFLHPASFNGDFGDQFEEMFEDEVIPMGALFISLLTSPSPRARYHLVTDEDDNGNLLGFSVIKLDDEMIAGLEDAVRSKFGMEPPKDPSLN